MKKLINAPDDVVVEALRGIKAAHPSLDVDVEAKVITDRPESLRAQRDTVPQHVEDAVMRALAKLPADRFASAADFVSALLPHHFGVAASFAPARNKAW